ncbi:MAG: HIT family protein [Patescibacteria group bacterium]
MDDCLFCKIIRGEIPASKVYEDEEVVAFLDIFPVNPGHTLVLPKVHGAGFLELQNELISKIMMVIKKITPAILAGVDAKDFNFGLNNGALAGQAIAHVHWHIMPRFEGDGHKLFAGRQYEPGQAEAVLKRIKENL